jgi:hypothetical protein
MVKVKPGAMVITIVSAQDVYGDISIVKPDAKVITIELAQNALSIDGTVKLFGTVFCGCSIVATFRRAIVATICVRNVLCRRVIEVVAVATVQTLAGDHEKKL